MSSTDDNKKKKVKKVLPKTKEIKNTTEAQKTLGGVGKAPLVTQRPDRPPTYTCR